MPTTNSAKKPKGMNKKMLQHFLDTGRGAAS